MLFPHDFAGAAVPTGGPVLGRDDGVQAAELIDAFATQMRRERAAVMSKSAQGATFVRFNAVDTKLVGLAVRALRGQVPPLLRFGFAIGVKEPTAPVPNEGLDVGTRVIVQANDLAAGAADGEVLVARAAEEHVQFLREREGRRADARHVRTRALQRA